MEQDADQGCRMSDDKVSTGGVSGLDFNFLDRNETETETWEGTSEPAEDGTSTMEPPPAFMNLSRDLPESSSPGKLKAIAMK